MMMDADERRRIESNRNLINEKERTIETMNSRKRGPSCEEAMAQQYYVETAAQNPLRSNKRHRGDGGAGGRLRCTHEPSQPKMARRHPFFTEAIFQERLMLLAPIPNEQASAQPTQEGARGTRRQPALSKHEDHHLNMLADVVASDNAGVFLAGGLGRQAKGGGGGGRRIDSRRSLKETMDELTKEWEEAVKNDRPDEDGHDDDDNNGNGNVGSSMRRNTVAWKCNDSRDRLPPGIPLQAPPRIPIKFQPGQIFSFLQ
jgi:hypothetical protein